MTSYCSFDNPIQQKIRQRQALSRCSGSPVMVDRTPCRLLCKQCISQNSIYNTITIYTEAALKLAFAYNELLYNLHN